MKTSYLFASATLTTVLIVTLPAQAQRLGGGVHGAASGMQTATGRFGTIGSAASGRGDASASSRAGARVDGVGRVDRTVKAGAQEAVRDAGHVKADTAGAGHQSVGAGETEASRASGAAPGTTRAAAGSTAGTKATAAGQSKAQVGNADTAGTHGGGLSATEVAGAGAKPEAGNSKPSAPDSPGTPRHGNPDKTSRGAAYEGEVDANASASANASATH